MSAPESIDLGFSVRQYRPSTKTLAIYGGGYGTPVPRPNFASEAPAVGTVFSIDNTGTQPLMVVTKVVEWTLNYTVPLKVYAMNSMNVANPSDMVLGADAPPQVSPGTVQPVPSYTWQYPIYGYIPPEKLTGIAPPDPVAASLNTTDAAANSKAKITATIPGVLGNGIRYRQLNPGANNRPASVTVSGRDVSVSLATGSGGAITTTGTQRNALIAASPAASALITAANLSGNTGAGLCSAFAYANLTGGTGGPTYPEEIPLPSSSGELPAAPDPVPL